MVDRCLLRHLCQSALLGTCHAFDQCDYSTTTLIGLSFKIKLKQIKNLKYYSIMLDIIIC